MTSQEIADWFGLKTVSSLSDKNNKGRKKYEELDYYCEYERCRGYFNITKILNPDIVEYSKVKPLVYELAEQKWNNDNPINTGANVGAQIYRERKDISSRVKQNTVSGYVNNWRRDKYGIPWVRQGEYGVCEAYLTKQIGCTGELQFIELSPEEKAIKNNLIKKYFGTDEEKLIYIIQEHEDGNITSDELAEAIKNVMNYSEFAYEAYLKELGEKLQLPKGAKLDKSYRIITTNTEQLDSVFE